MYAIRIQNKIFLFQNGSLLGKVPIEKIQNFFMENNLIIPVVKDENNDDYKLLIKEYFGERE
ncbi:hypothetical protein [Aliarcobacter butzleri]|uniref:hypothetical protein n=1 Tax=Aliarcobacter butzleri TaxID=28197 RepID=UPI001EDBC4D1|nr:hypothetical protein [Aliarcobacter butzleri]MCG3677396.1 hypothetical protein [Aliarcobacter butzleri]